MGGKPPRLSGSRGPPSSRRQCNRGASLQNQTARWISIGRQHTPPSARQQQHHAARRSLAGPLECRWRPPLPWPLDLENYATMPTVLGNGMISSIASLALTGVIWYQARPTQFKKLLPALIQDWREQLAQGDFTFYMVSLPAFMAHRAEPGFDGWTAVREVQIQTAQLVPNCGAAITVDTGEADNIHPKEKRTVGERLALLALAGHYHRAILASGPIFRSQEQQGNTLRLHFDAASGALAIHGETPGEFAVAGPDRKWRWTTAKIDGETIIVPAPDVSSPVAVRYAWQANPKATLFNTADLPAAPYRTDD